LLRSLLHRADVDEAVSAISRQGRLPRQAERALLQLCSEPFDAWAGIGCAIHASVLAVDGQAKAAEAELHQAFSKWVEAQASAMKPSIPENAMARDAMAIRDLLFEPDGVDARESFEMQPQALLGGGGTNERSEKREVQRKGGLLLSGTGIG